jgi:hypothetical protein
MDEVTLVAQLDDGTTIYVSPVHDQAYREYVDGDNLGGPAGYFIARERRDHFEVLAKATSLDAARELFGMLTARARA